MPFFLVVISLQNIGIRAWSFPQFQEFYFGACHVLHDLTSSLLTSFYILLISLLLLFLPSSAAVAPSILFLSFICKLTLIFSLLLSRIPGKSCSCTSPTSRASSCRARATPSPTAHAPSRPDSRNFRRVSMS